MNKEFLKKLLETVSVSGNEEPNQENALAFSDGFAEAQIVDPVGSVIAACNLESPVRVLLQGHMDEIGFRVTYISGDGIMNTQKLMDQNNRVYIFKDDGSVDYSYQAK